MCKYFNMYQWKTCYVKSSTFSSGGQKYGWFGNYGKGHYEENLCEIMLNFSQ